MEPALFPTPEAPSGTVPALPSGMWRQLAGKSTPAKLPKGLDAAWAALEARAQQKLPRKSRYMRRAKKVLVMRARYEAMSDEQLQAAIEDIKPVFARGRDKSADLERAFAVISEAAWRKLNMRPYLVQVAAAFAIYNGCCAELATGEGKTLVATLPATVAGWRARGCHVLTVNDYLAKRDAEEMGPLYRFCGLRVGYVIGDMKPPERREGYLADITYTTNKEACADFLRDRLAMGRQRGLSSALLSRIADGGIGMGARTDRLVMRGMEFAIVDEADSILIDEAVTPLIISGESPNEEQVEAFAEAAELATKLENGKHYKVNHRWREVVINNRGKAELDDLTEEMGGVWAGRRRREELVTQALTARELFIRDQQYVIREDKVVIVDESTGRLMPDRTWRDGLHQAIEAKEKVEIQPPKITLARVSFQRFFRLYKKLGGMTGTGWESRNELWTVYRMPVVRIPTNKPCIRKQMPDRIFRRADDRWRAVVEQIRQKHALNQPVLVGTRSVDASELLSEMLNELGLPHQVLNAVRHKEEAEIVQYAGQPGRITVATNMAGRGTDIKLGPGVPELGGLFVLATERHESRRVDRQLYGRAARQGDPGLAESYVSCDDELFLRYAPKWMRRLIRLASGGKNGKRSILGSWLIRMAQARANRFAARQRRSVLRSDDWLDENLAFAGPDL